MLEIGPLDKLGKRQRNALPPPVVDETHDVQRIQAELDEVVLLAAGEWLRQQGLDLGDEVRGMKSVHRTPSSGSPMAAGLSTTYLRMQASFSLVSSSSRAGLDWPTMPAPAWSQLSPSRW